MRDLLRLARILAAAAALAAMTACMGTEKPVVEATGVPVGGGAESNKTLGLKRADAVRAYLGSLGLASARMRTKTFGNLTERLVHNCNDLSCRAQNRRVVTVLERETGV